jgi:hypothetical protein
LVVSFLLQNLVFLCWLLRYNEIKICIGNGGYSNSVHAFSYSCFKYQCSSKI